MDTTQPDLVQLTSEPPAHNLAIERSTAIRDHFPFPSIRDAQDKAMSAVERAVATKKKFTIIEAPTGIGKSGFGIAAASWAKTIPTFGQFQQGGYILSPQKTLTAQYMKDFGNMGLLELKGRANYWCTRHDTDCDCGALLNGSGAQNVEAGDDREECPACPYRMAKNDFKANPLGVTNFAYYLNETVYAGQLSPRTMLVLDEGHNTEGQILGFTDTEITERRANEHGAGRVPYIKPGENDKCRSWLRTTFVPATQEYMRKLEDLKESAKLSGNKNDALKFAKKLDSTDKFLCRLNRFIMSDDPANWLCWTEKDGTLTIKPLTATLFADEVLFRKAQHILIMSATIVDFGTFMRNLGIKNADTEMLALDSEFPLVNRPIYFRPAGNMSFKYIDQTLPKLAQMVEKIMLKYPNEKGIIHTHSYKINSYLHGYLKAHGLAGRILTHNGDVQGSREKAVYDHFNSPEPTVLMSPSMTEGLDLKEDLSRFQVLCKVPYPALTPYVKARMQRDPDWYNWCTGLTMIQATGRSVRTKVDKADTYILDSAFEYFLTKYGSKLSKWWTDSIKFPGEK